VIMKNNAVTEKLDWRTRIFDTIPFPALILSTEMIIISANQAFLEKKNTDLKKVVGKTCHHVFYQMDIPCSADICPFSKVIAEKKAHSITKRIESEENEEAWVDRMFSPILDEKGNVKFIMECVRDVTRLITLEKRSIRMRQFLDKVIQSSHNAIVAADMNGNILLMNQAAEKLFGFSMEDAIQTKNAKDLYPSGKAKEVMAHLKSEDLGGKGKLSASRLNILNVQGETVPVEMSGAIIYDDNNVEVASTGIFYDLREIIAEKMKLKDLLNQINQSEKMASLGQLAAGVAHEINNPLTGILLYSNLALERLDDKTLVRKYMESVLDDTGRCRDIVKNLLAYSRPDSPSKEIFEANLLVAYSLNLMRDQELFSKIKIVKEMSEKMILIHADKKQLSQVIINLTINAIDAMERKGSLIFRTYRNKTDKLAYIEVSDTGCGIPKDTLSKVFDPFFTTKETGKGTGLGLSTSYGIVEENDGHISIKETGPEGTTFLIELPLYVPSEQTTGT